jgi:hypothetical protein
MKLGTSCFCHGLPPPLLWHCGVGMEEEMPRLHSTREEGTRVPLPETHQSLSKSTIREVTLGIIIFKNRGKGVLSLEASGLLLRVSTWAFLTERIQMGASHSCGRSHPMCAWPMPCPERAACPLHVDEC